MKFKITSIGRNNNQVIHYYDNLTQDIWTEKNIPIYLDQDPRCKDLIHKTKKVYYDSSFIQSNLRELRIQLGLNCNFHCKYCNQRKGSALEQSIKQIKLPDEIRVKNFINFLKKENITVEKIALWGGEPMVYFKLLKILVPELRKLYPDVMISTISNGSLVNKEKIDFFLQHKISLTISHDAQAFTVYRDDKNPLDNPEIIKELNRYIDNVQNQNNIWFGINVVVVPENCDVLQIDDYFTSKFGRQVSWHFESTAKLDCESKDIISAFNEKQKKILLNGLFSLGTQEPENEISDLRRRVSKLLEALVNKFTPASKPYPCDTANNDVLATTLDGEVLACHGASKELFTVGHLKDFGKVKNTKVISWDKRDNCSKCPYLFLCGGGCAIASNEDVNAACDNLKLWYTGQFAAAWFLLFDVVIQKIEPIEQ